VVSQKAQKALTAGEAVEVVLSDYLGRHDITEQKDGPRRLPDTRGRPGRAMARGVMRWVETAYGGKCPIWLCDNELLKDRAHIKAKAEDGDQEAENIGPPCCGHHGYHGKGLIQVQEIEGRRYWVNQRGKPIGDVLDPPARLRPPPPGLPFEEGAPGEGSAGPPGCDGCCSHDQTAHAAVASDALDGGLPSPPGHRGSEGSSTTDSRIEGAQAAPSDGERSTRKEAEVEPPEAA
jgi:hypothetical protein